MELTLTRQAGTQVAVTCDGQPSHTFDLPPLPDEKKLLYSPDYPIAYGKTLYTTLFPPETPAQSTLATTPERILLVSTDPDLDAILEVNVKAPLRLVREAWPYLTANGEGRVVTVVSLSNFTGAQTQFGSLGDGRYTLTVLASQISGNGQPLDGNGDGTPGDNYTFGDAQGLYRFFGDINGDRHVDIADFGLFSQSIFNSANYIAAFDFNSDGHIDIADFGQFSIRFFTILP